MDQLCGSFLPSRAGPEPAGGQAGDPAGAKAGSRVLTKAQSAFQSAVDGLANCCAPNPEAGQGRVELLPLRLRSRCSGRHAKMLR